MAVVQIKKNNSTETYPLETALSFINYRTNTPMKLWVGTVLDYNEDHNAPEEGVVYIITQN